MTDNAESEVKNTPKRNVDEYLEKFLKTPKKLDENIDIEFLLDEQYI
jgi:hypothetical protein